MYFLASYLLAYSYTTIFQLEKYRETFMKKIIICHKAAVSVYNERDKS